MTRHIETVCTTCNRNHAQYGVCDNPSPVLSRWQRRAVFVMHCERGFWLEVFVVVGLVITLLMLLVAVGVL